MSDRRVLIFEQAVFCLLSLPVGCGGIVESVSQPTDFGTGVLDGDASGVDEGKLSFDAPVTGDRIEGADVPAAPRAAPPSAALQCGWSSLPGHAPAYTCWSVSFVGNPVVCAGFPAGNGTLSQCLGVCGPSFGSCSITYAGYGRTYRLDCRPVTDTGDPCINMNPPPPESGPVIR